MKYISDKFGVALAIVFFAMAIAISIPTYLRSRPNTATNACSNTMKRIDEAKRKWAEDHGKTSSDIPTWEAIWPYLDRGTNVEIPRCPIRAPFGEEYVLVRVAEPQKCPTEGSGH